LEYFWIESVPEPELWYDRAIVPDELAHSIGLTMCGDDGGTVIINDVTHVRKNDALQALSDTQTISRRDEED
jgi:hypothetical protein